MVNPDHKFHLADLILFGLTIVISIGIGIYHAFSGGRQRTTSEYLVGGRKMSFIPVAISLMVSFESSIMMLGVPAEVYVFGIQWWIACLGFFTANICGIFLVVPILHPLGLTSVYEYLEIRFKSKAPRIMGTILGILSTLWYMGVVLFGPGIALEAVTGFPKWASICLIALAAAIYTSIGGLKAVIWTDVFQAVVMFCGCFALLIKATIYAGGPTAVWEKGEAGGRFNFFVFDTDFTVRHTFWGLYFGSLLRGMGMVFNQSTCQRITSTPTLRAAYRVLFITSPLHIVALSLAAYEGIVAFAYYTTVRCDPLESGQITNPNQIIPYMVMDIFRSLPGMPGLFLASLFSASLSTLSTGLSGLSAIFLQDIVKEKFKTLSEFRSTLVAKISVIISAVLASGIAIVIGEIGGTMIQISGSVISAFSGPLTGLFLLGVLCPWANSKGAVAGSMISMVFCSWLGMGSSFSRTLRKTPWLPLAPIDHCPVDNSTFIEYNMTSPYMYNPTVNVTEVYATELPEPQGLDRMYAISYTWFGAIGVILAFVAGAIISLLTGSMDKEDIDPRLMVPILIKLGSCLPKSVKRFLRFDLDLTKKREKKIMYTREAEVIVNEKPPKIIMPEEMTLLNQNKTKS
ncbi:hypothetical protein LOTGIDRAFT_160120 [Lottia gigantea]|uniref:Uncharacterized protein n=1 Tax=Lottia gigantea TaxID=225164 RepID=V3ZX78_LOTGI|nr:hypothetical protein LOTGIDRAFT_160120 [Lottia gigantea]ESO96133.1 hypothetical protein LOTGIDRAFT_160120 [Lottia gigantea]